MAKDQPLVSWAGVRCSTQTTGKIIIAYISTAPLSKGWGIRRGCIGLPALQPVPCLSRSGVSALYISITEL